VVGTVDAGARYEGGIRIGLAGGLSAITLAKQSPCCRIGLPAWMESLV